MARRETYENVASEMRRPLPPAAPDGVPPFSDLVRFASLAANSHNTQPWRFDRDQKRIVIRPDPGRRCTAVDPDDHHLYASLGCAAENLVIAATAYGITAEPRFLDDGENRVEIRMGLPGASRSPLVDAIPRRQSTRSAFTGPKLTAEEHDALTTAAARPSVEIRMIDGREKVDRLRDLIIAGNTAQLADKAFVRELRSWIRFGQRSALARRDGLFSGCMGSPRLPDWLGRLVFPLVLRAGPENRKYREQIDSSAALAVFISAEDRPENWFETGRAFQGFALEATRLGLAHAHVNQAVEVPEIRAMLARELGLGTERPSLIIRLGRARPLPYSLRRPVDDIADSP